MPLSETVPITPAVLDWAMGEVGATNEYLAGRVGANPADVRAWRLGDAQPRKAQFKKLARALRRPTSFFFLPEPPRSAGIRTAFRREPGFLHGRDLFPNEAAAVRRARRMQKISHWVVERGGGLPADLPRLQMRQHPESAAAIVRDWASWDVSEQFEARDSYAVARGLRTRLQERGVLTLHFSSQEEQACRAFSLHDELAPLIAVNTQFRYRGPARSFSYLHELAHLVLGDSAICSFARDRRIERWCEEFAASFLLPRDAVDSVLEELGLDYIGANVDLAQKVANRFRVSLSATAIELIQLGRADEVLYRRVERLARGRTEPKKGEGPRTPTPKRRVQELGARYPDLLFTAEKQNLLRRTDILDYLDVSDAQLDAVRQLVSG